MFAGPRKKWIYGTWGDKHIQITFLYKAIKKNLIKFAWLILIKAIRFLSKWYNQR